MSLSKGRLFFAGLILGVFLSLSSFGQNVYSGASGNYDAIQWYSNQARTIPFVGVPGVLNTLNIGNGHNVTIVNGTTASFAGIVVHDTGASGTLTFGTANPNTASSLTITGDIVVNSGGSFVVSGNNTGSVLHSLNVSGNITNNNIFNLYFGANDRSDLTFTGLGTKTFGGTGTTSLFTLRANTTLGADININNSVSIVSQLNFLANGLLILNSTSNITLLAGATIVGSNSNRYIQQDGSTSSGSQLIITNNNTTAAWAIVWPIGTAAGGYTPADLTGAVTVNPTANSTLAIKTIQNPSIQGQMRRQFRLSVAGNAAATTITNADFSYNVSGDISSGDVISNYNTNWYLSVASGTWQQITGTAPGGGVFVAPGTAQTLGNGTYYYAIGSATAFTNVWYSYQNGVWSEPDVWTLDPSGTSLNNPLNQPPSAGDQVVILNGFTVTVDAPAGAITLSTTTIQGGAVLDMGTTSGHTLGTVTGSGLLRINGVALPTGTYTAFVATTGGTIEYYNTGGTLPTTQTTYNKLLFTNSTGADITYVQASNLTVNGTFDISTTGAGTVTWQINDASNTQRTVILNSDLTVATGGRIRVGTGTPAVTGHIMTTLGNITNNGSIKFFDPNNAVLSDANYTSGAVHTSASQTNTVNVTFSGTNDATITCNGQTDFYRLILNKGTGPQALLQVNSSSTANFRLFAPNNLGSTGTAPNQNSNNALSLVNGTLELTGSLTIPNMVQGGGSFPIPQNAVFWMNGSGVTVQVTGATEGGLGGNSRMLFVYGTLKVSAGLLNSGYSRGLLCGTSGQLIVEGGTINTWQLRTTNAGSGNNFAYTQSGGIVNVGTAGLSGEDVNDFPRFALPQTTTVFTMSGGTLNVATPMNGGTANTGGIMINSAANNINVTGGTIHVMVPASAVNFTITSNAPFGNVIISKEGAGAGVAILNGISCNDGTTTINQAAQPLIVRNDLTLLSANGPTFNCNNNNLNIGRHFDMQSGTTFIPGTNVITFDGTAAQNWVHDATTFAALASVVVNKSAGTLTLTGANTIPTIATALTLTSGTLNDNGKSITVSGALTNNAVHTGTGLLTYSGTGTINGNNGTFGNLTVSNSSTIVVAGNQTVTGNLRLTGAATSLNIGSNNLTVLQGIYSDAATGVGGFGTGKRIFTNGFRNDGGITRQAASGVDLLFPIGTAPAATAYTPITINATATTAGRITVQPVKNAHPNVTTSTQSVQYFWRVTSSGFTGLGAVFHKNYVYLNATRDAASATYRPARYNSTANTWSYGGTYDATAGSGLTEIATTSTTANTFNTGDGTWTGIATSVLDGEYTAGNLAAFGTVTVYYSRVASGTWGNASSWSTVAINGPAAGSPPCATCPVVIGDATNNHTITNNANNQSCGSLFIGANSVLDCGALTGLNFGVNTSGSGKIRIASVNFPAGDFVNFLGTAGGTVEWYGTSYTIPIVAASGQSLTNYYNLQVSPNAGQIITLPGTAGSPNLTVYNNFIITGTGSGQVRTHTNAVGTITVGNNMDVTSGALSIRNANVTNFIVNGTTTVGGSFLLQGGGTRTHTFRSNGSFINNNILTFRNGTEVVNLTFGGTTNSSFSGTGAGGTTLNNLIVDKGTSSTPVLTIDIGGTLNLLTDNWFTLSNGTVDFNRAGGTFTFFSTLTNSFTIPATAKLKVSDGTVNITTDNANTGDLLLAGQLEVAGASATLNVGASGNNNNNDIEYASAGTPTIVVSAGTLYVNGAIRRPTTTLSGSLNYNQSGGTVTIGGRSALNTRAVLDIDNAGSSFTLTGSSILNIVRPTGGTQFADLYLNPATSTVSTASNIQLGLITAPQTIDINVTPAIGSLTILGAAGNAQTVNMQSSDLTTSGTLAINTASILNPTSLNVTVGGDLSIVGTYNGGANTTTFNGVGAQAGVLSSSSSFLNITLNKPSGTVTLSGTSPTITNLNILSGVLDVGALDLTVTGNIVNNSSQIGSGTIQMAGAAAVTTHTITSSGGSFTNLTLAGAASTKTVSVDGNMSILGTLNFASTSRYLNIGSGLLTFGASSSVTNAGNTAFVKTNGSDSDLGVVKSWAAGAGTFTYPIGTATNYTPVTFTLNVTTPGDINVIPVNDRHPTAFPSGEQILNYYWIVNRGSIVYTATGSHVYGYPTALLGGSGGTLRAAYLDIASATPGWTTTGHGGTATTTAMTYTNLLNTNLPTTSNTYHYSVGTNTTSTATLPNPIVPVYSRLADASVANTAVGGDWNNTNSWTLQSDGLGAPWGSIPFGNSVVILPNSRINITQSGRKTFINQIDGLLVLPSDKVGHSFGIMRGTGTMRTTTNTFPAGNYTAFVASGGGTIEYVAPMTMNSRAIYNNLSVIGTGAVTMTNTDLTLNGSVNIGTGTTLNNGTNNRNMSVAGGWTTGTGGSFTAGTATVTFTGSTAGSVNGTTTFNNVTIAKTGANITLAGTGTTTVNNTFTLTSGHLVTSATHLLSLPLAATISGGSATSYISGPVRKVVAASGTLSLPLGSVSANRYRPAVIANTSALDTWTSEYVGADPTTGGYSPYTFNSANIQKVSMFEYWLISRPGATVADVTLTYNTGSYIPNPTNIGNVANLRVVRWDGTRWDLPPGSGTHSQAGTDVTGTVMVTNVTNFSPLTFGSLDADSPLPVTWGPFEARWEGEGVALRWTTVQEINNDHFEIERSEDGIEFYAIGLQAGQGNSSVQKQYRYFDSEASKSRYHYYRIKQVDFDGKFDYSRIVVVAPIGDGGRFWVTYPNPVEEKHTFVLEQVETSSQHATINVVLYSSQGIMLYQASGTTSEVSDMINKKLHNSRSGVYVLKVTNGLITETFKIVRH